MKHNRGLLLSHPLGSHQRQSITPGPACDHPRLPFQMPGRPNYSPPPLALCPRPPLSCCRLGLLCVCLVVLQADIVVPLFLFVVRPVASTSGRGAPSSAMTLHAATAHKPRRRTIEENELTHPLLGDQPTLQLIQRRDDSGVPQLHCLPPSWPFKHSWLAYECENWLMQIQGPADRAWSDCCQAGVAVWQARPSVIWLRAWPGCTAMPCVMG